MACGKKPGTLGYKSIFRKGRLQSRQLDEQRSALEEELKRKGVLGHSEEEKQDMLLSTGQAIKLSSEFLAAVIMGIVLGLGFEQVVGGSPWGLIIFLFLGFTTGVLNVLRSVGLDC
ncbi:MAG: ATP synthase protein I [Candidatus Tokpelaia sp. JSC189]|nr:MAG: ATP synthase protein I [Candidatus Tokpelaia sp. JSC189]